MDDKNEIVVCVAVHINQTMSKRESGGGMGVGMLGARRREKVRETSTGEKERYKKGGGD